MIVASVADFRVAARRRLPRFLFEYMDGGSYAEVTLRRNIEDLSAIALRQRVLRDVSELDLSTELFGQRIALPVALTQPEGCAGWDTRRRQGLGLRDPLPTWFFTIRRLTPLVCHHIWVRPLVGRAIIVRAAEGPTLWSAIYARS